MRKVFLAGMAIVLNMFLFSCDKESIAEHESVLETLTTEGDDGQVKPPPEGDK